MENEPTYKDYLKATKYARWKYKYGLFVLILCWIALLLLSYFIYSYGEELASNPFIYGAKKSNLNCFCSCTDVKNNPIFFNLNSTTISIIGRENRFAPINISNISN